MGGCYEKNKGVMEISKWKKNNNWNDRNVGWSGSAGIFSEPDDTGTNKFHHYNWSSDRWNWRYSQRSEIPNTHGHKNKTEREINYKPVISLKININKLIRRIKNGRKKRIFNRGTGNHSG